MAVYKVKPSNSQLHDVLFLWVSLSVFLLVVSKDDVVSITVQSGAWGCSHLESI